MTIGTRSVLFGAHCFWIHPWFVAWAWWKLYGFPWDPRLWVAFFVHDLGYIGKPNMDGTEGESHVLFGATVMSFFDSGEFGRWERLALFHSRFWAKKFEAEPSALCAADKLAAYLTPWWLYLPCVNLTGEIHEYMDRAGVGKYANDESPMLKLRNSPEWSQRVWHKRMTEFCRDWAYANRAPEISGGGQ